jgi:hypothetical protein
MVYFIRWWIPQKDKYVQSFQWIAVQFHLGIMKSLMDRATIVHCPTLIIYSSSGLLKLALAA